MQKQANAALGLNSRVGERNNPIQRWFEKYGIAEQAGLAQNQGHLTVSQEIGHGFGKCQEWVQGGTGQKGQGSDLEGELEQNCGLTQFGHQQTHLWETDQGKRTQKEGGKLEGWELGFEGDSNEINWE